MSFEEWWGRVQPDEDIKGYFKDAYISGQHSMCSEYTEKELAIQLERALEVIRNEWGNDSSVERYVKEGKYTDNDWKDSDDPNNN